MTEEQPLQALIEKRLHRYFSEVQQRHNAQREEVNKIAAGLSKLSVQLDKARRTIMDSHSAELSEFREMIRVIEMLISAAQERKNAPDADSSVDVAE